MAVMRTRANISVAAIPSAVRKLNRRLNELREIEVPELEADLYGMAAIVANRINATIDDVFGVSTADNRDFRVQNDWFTLSYGPTTWDVKAQAFMRGRDRAAAAITTAIERLKEKAADADADAAEKVLRAYEGLDLHPEIARAASNLYVDGHYANAIEVAVTALNNLVRLRSGMERDGTPLMETAFSPKNPILRFNDLRDQTDRDEQTGFMMMFCGAVAGLRNPRAHRLIQDDAERALEIIAFVSLLAKLLDRATQGTH